MSKPTVISSRAPMESGYVSGGPGGIWRSAGAGNATGPLRVAGVCRWRGEWAVYSGLSIPCWPVLLPSRFFLPSRSATARSSSASANEAQTAARLNHQNVVQVYHIGEDAGLAYIVFEFLEGLNIRALVEKRGVLPLAEALGYTFQIAEALAHASSRNVVHRDIKPSNVLVTSQGQAKLIDLGLARLLKNSEDAGDLTASGVTLGTFDYISPEQARDPRTADARSDIYSLGCTLFYMLAGRPPFPQGTVLQKLLQHQGEEPPDVREFRPELPPEVSRLVRKMMAKDPRRRFQRPQQLIDAMAVLAFRVGSASGPQWRGELGGGPRIAYSASAASSAVAGAAGGPNPFGARARRLLVISHIDVRLLFALDAKDRTANGKWAGAGGRGADGGCRGHGKGQLRRHANDPQKYRGNAFNGPESARPGRAGRCVQRSVQNRRGRCVGKDRSHVRIWPDRFSFQTDRRCGPKWRDSRRALRGQGFALAIVGGSCRGRGARNPDRRRRRLPISRHRASAGTWPRRHFARHPGGRPRGRSQYLGAGPLSDTQGGLCRGNQRHRDRTPFQWPQRRDPLGHRQPQVDDPRGPKASSRSW